MKKAAVLAVACAAIGITVGCKQEDQDKIVAQGKQAISSAEKAVGDAVGSLMSQVSNIDWKSSSEAIEKAKRKALDVEKSLNEIHAPTSIDQLHLEAVKEQVTRLEAALTVKNLQSEWDAAVKKAGEGKDLAEDRVKEVGEKLRETDREFRDLDDKLQSAKKAYQAASDKVDETLSKVRGEEKSPDNAR